MSPTESFAAPVSVVVSVVACSTTEIVVAPVLCAERAFPEPDAQALTATTRTRIPPSGRTMLRTRFMMFLLGWVDVRAYSTRQARVKGTPCWHGFRRDPVGPLSRLLRHHRGVADAIDETCDMRIAVVSAQPLERAPPKPRSAVSRARRRSKASCSAIRTPGHAEDPRAPRLQRRTRGRRLRSRLRLGLGPPR